MKLSEENKNYIENFIRNELRFMPNYDDSSFLPFAIGRPFVVYDISKVTDEEIDLLYELAPTALANCVPEGHQLYAVDWFHSTILYDPGIRRTIKVTLPTLPIKTVRALPIFLDFIPAVIITSSSKNMAPLATSLTHGGKKCGYTAHHL